MSDHYYSNRPSAAHDRKTIDVELRGKKVRLVTDAGVFSKSGLDYGSRVLIEALEIPEGASVLDVGCGYGPIGIAAGLMGASSVTMLDVNERAVELARENAAANGILQAKAMQSDLLEAVSEESFDVIITNPPIRAGKETVHRLFEQASDRLNPGGSLWIVIQKKQGAPSAKAKLESLFDRVEEVTKDKGYRIYQAIKG
ncbi:class I SAM-dependent methyltransferase [Saccharibacillus alkalitolerans]|uniref:Class I SAM-dependent methyltransferase n=1 Tax=Saccharibacillus alkalitolerans TaxID=2705290 RepID=A0ABX0FCE9_9BACL|nr:class I SAM-dependent methyltransferase [Saccharibacillus alkalitolerans]NGZ78085.1 class I SAM-dependent methyltransferase [Saccharibacillus alkalitolerans]